MGVDNRFTPLMILDLFKEDTHTVELSSGLSRKWLEDRGYIKWHPPIFGSNRQYEITEAGKAYRDKIK